MSIYELENIRKDVVKKEKTIYVVLLLEAIVIEAISIILRLLGYEITIFDHINTFLSLIVTFMVITVVCLITYIILYGKLCGKKIAFLNENYKKIFVKSALEKVFDNLEYNYNKGLSKSILESTGMVNTGDRYYSNDYIKGKYNNINVVLSDVHIEERNETTDSDGDTRVEYEDIFNGRWLIFDFNKKFKANIQVVASGFDANSFEMNLYQEFDTKKLEENISKDIKFITKFVKKLNLDNNLFKE